MFSRKASVKQKSAQILLSNENKGLFLAPCVAWVRSSASDYTPFYHLLDIELLTAY